MMMCAVPLPRNGRAWGPGAAAYLVLHGSTNLWGAVLFSGKLAQGRQPGSSAQRGWQRIGRIPRNTLTFTGDEGCVQPRRTAGGPVYRFLNPVGARVQVPQGTSANKARADIRLPPSAPRRCECALQQKLLVHRGARPPPLPTRPGFRTQRASPILVPTL